MKQTEITIVPGTQKVHFVETRNTHIESISHTEKVIAAIGVNNLVIIDTADAVLVSSRDKAQEVKLVVNALKAGADFELTELPATVHRPWGTYTKLVKKTAIKLNESLLRPVRN